MGFFGENPSPSKAGGDLILQVPYPSTRGKLWSNWYQGTSDPTCCSQQSQDDARGTGKGGSPKLLPPESPGSCLP